MLGVARALREQGLASRLLLQVHDELVLEVAPGEREELAALLRREMGSAYPELSVPLDVSVGVGARRLPFSRSFGRSMLLVSIAAGVSAPERRAAALGEVLPAPQRVVGCLTEAPTEEDRPVGLRWYDAPVSAEASMGAHF
jgi:hypothetical protein